MSVITSAYNPIIPQAADFLSFSQGQLLNNFGSIKTLVDMDHVDFANGTNGGAHYRVTFISSGATQPPNPQTGSAGDNTWNTASLATVVGLYSAANTTSTQTELYINKTNASGVVQVPSTASILSTTATPAALSAGWTYLPSGILLKWAANIVATGQQTITFPTGATIPAFTTCFTVIPIIANGGAGDVDQAVRLTAVTNTTFSVYASPRTTTGAIAITFSYLAIGY